MLIINGSEVSNYEKEMMDAFELRHSVFVDEKGWNALKRDNGLESDKFDNEHAVHMLLYVENELIGYQRMLPTTHPTLLSEVYPELCDGSLPKSEFIWEWTRFAVRKTHRKGGRKLGLAGNLLLSEMVDWGLKSNIRQVIIQMDPLWLLSLTSLHFKLDALGFPMKINGSDTLAVKATFNEDTLDQLLQVREEIQTRTLAYGSAG